MTNWYTVRVVALSLQHYYSRDSLTDLISHHYLRERFTYKSICKRGLTCHGIHHNNPRRIVIRLSTESIQLKRSLVLTSPLAFTPLNLSHGTLNSHRDLGQTILRYYEFKDTHLRHKSFLSLEIIVYDFMLSVPESIAAVGGQSLQRAEINYSNLLALPIRLWDTSLLSVALVACGWCKVYFKSLRLGKKS